MRVRPSAATAMPNAPGYAQGRSEQLANRPRNARAHLHPLSLDVEGIEPGPFDPSSNNPCDAGAGRERLLPGSHRTDAANHRCRPRTALAQTRPSMARTTPSGFLRLQRPYPQIRPAAGPRPRACGRSEHPAPAASPWSMSGRPSSGISAGSAASMTAEDCIPRDPIHPGRVGETQGVRRNLHREWLYFPNMALGEAMLLKCYDSDDSGRARFTAPSVFEDPASGLDAPERESAEVRTLAFFRRPLVSGRHSPAPTRQGNLGIAARSPSVQTRDAMALHGVAARTDCTQSDATDQYPSSSP